MIQAERKNWVDIDVEDEESQNENENKQKWEDIDAEDDLESNKKLSYFTNYENGIKVVTKYSENLKKQTVKVGPLRTSQWKASTTRLPITLTQDQTLNESSILFTSFLYPPRQVTKKIKEVVIKKKLNKEINNRLNLKNFNIDTVRITPCGVHHAMYTMRCTPCDVHHAMYTMRCTPCDVHHARNGVPSGLLIRLLYVTTYRFRRDTSYPPPPPLPLLPFPTFQCSSVIVEPTDVVNIEVPKNNLLDFLKGTEYDYLFTEQADKTAKDLKNRFKIFKDEDVEEVKPEDPNKLGAKREMLFYRSHETQNKECTVRVTNLSEEVNESELSNLFGRVGQISRMFLAKHKETQNSKGFAFITYSNREEAKRAIEKLNRHGFENLLLSVEWAKPSNR
ncbi:eukaryotictranslation initiation factor, putative [Plasmodium knowlesi strain H]|uniref:Eukaryotictranslation initiation factor, putative n=1 Tax=Plasmodium knowlesi (strain H) TaxID=5851 RepID=A0A1A7W195_PLAKH|nr:eukaryotictranslation initiation factor, putative [Plasmodium knowlesi strain H]